MDHGHSQAGEDHRSRQSTPAGVDAAAQSTAIPRIEAHGAIGNLATVALVCTDGTIDYLCWPKLDSPSIFASLLDPTRGGSFTLAPVMEGAETRQIYWPDSNVLCTRWVASEASIECVDLLLLDDGKPAQPPRLVRRVKVLRGTAEVRLSCAPRFFYGLRHAVVTPCPGGARLAGEADDPVLRLTGTAPIGIDGNAATATFTLRTGQSAAFLLEDDADGEPPNADAIDAALAATDRYWREWTAQSSYRGRWREAVNRSALVLKMLTSREHGSIAAAATFALPERPGGDLNWDYRATWVRDASYSVYALMRLGYTEESNAFMRWMAQRAETCGHGADLRIMYRLDGSDRLDEQELDNLDGYGGARPVRVGNAAAEQIQLDIYGELLDSIYINAKYGDPPGYDGWCRITQIVDYVCKKWHKPDAGIWEVRGPPQRFLHSRLMCWVAVDRALRLAQKRSLPAPYGRWAEVRNDIHTSIWADFWRDDLGHFVQAVGSDDVDGALLLMPLVRFVTGTDPRWIATLDAITKHLVDDGFVFRTPAGRAGQEGAFAACSFWYVECLVRAGRIELAHNQFERVLSYGNHLGLFAEEWDVQAHHLGNFPQALTHLALISAAYSLDRELSGKPVMR